MKKGISQEGLKIIACLSMLMDHIGVVLIPLTILRILGRLSFPLFCFLLAEGFRHTKNRRRYAFRLLLCGLMAELPFDLALSGGLCWQQQNVMLTLLIGFLTLWGMETWGGILPLAAGMLAAAIFRGDYGCAGVALVVLFHFSREEKRLLPGMALCFILMPSQSLFLLGLPIPVQIFGLLALLPIACYSGEKRTNSRTVQWSFYLFYPAHLLVLYGLSKVLK